MSLLNKFIKIVKASIEDDMANRIMYSLITSKATPNELYYNDGVVNQDVLDLAVEGINDLIKYGSLAVLDELSYLDESIYNKNLNKNKIENDIKSNNYNLILDFLKKAYNLFTKEQWDDGFGGYAWAKITKSLHDLTNLKINLSNETDKSKQNKIKKLIILEMNYFDSLSHNNGSILEKMARQEHEDSLNLNEHNSLLNEFFKLAKVFKEEILLLKEKYKNSDILQKNLKK